MSVMQYLPWLIILTLVPITRLAISSSIAAVLRAQYRALRLN
ncbi:MAG: hypothetical protein ACM358_16220 [Gemmatimonadota bacterium]